MQKSFYRTWAHIALFAANLIYGLNFTVVKAVMPEWIKPMALVSFRSLLTAALFWITGFFLPREKVERKDLLYLFLFSFLGVVINQTLFLAGLALTTPINSSIIMAINPVAAFVFTAIILKERISLVRGAGLAVGLGGILILILHEGRPDLSSSTFVGNIFTLINTLSWALFTVLIKRMLEKYRPVTVMKWIFTFGMLTNIPIGYHQWSVMDWGSIPLLPWLAIGFVVIFATYLGYLLITFGLKRLSPTIVSSYTYTQPIVAAIVASMLGQDSISVLKIFSAVLIFAGVFLVGRQQNPTL
ncbi:MAG TPA: DMT family transporter [Bacteroidales bacterium]|nr:DMT family transporter [Bacteroidales bacterium]